MQKFLLACLLSACPALPAAAGAPPGNAILVGWDGAQRSRVRKMLDEGKLPGLARLVREGSLALTEVVTGPTETKSGWAEILTGYSSGRLGIISNLDYRPIPAGQTVFERLKAAYGGGIALVFIAGKRYNLGARGLHEVCVNADSRDVTRVQNYYPDRALFNGTTRDGKPPRWEKREGEPYLNAAGAVDLFYADGIAAEEVGRRAVAALKKYRRKPFFAFIHFRDPDEQGHLHGEGSPEYEEALAASDRQLGRLIAELERLKLYSRTAVFVTTDHGFEEGRRTHMNAPLMFFAANRGLKLRDGDRKDVAPTILRWYGLDADKISPPLDGRSLLAK